MMNRGEIYNVIAPLLEPYRTAEFEELGKAIGDVKRDSIRVGHEDIAFEIGVWCRLRAELLDD
jgi:hypothetical protein